MFIDYEIAQTLLSQQKIIHIIADQSVDTLSTISILKRFLFLKQICFTVAFDFVDQDEGFFVFINQKPQKQQCIFITSQSPIDIKYVISDSVLIIDDGQFIQQFLYVFEPKKFYSQQLDYQKVFVQQENQQNSYKKEHDSEIQTLKQSQDTQELTDGDIQIDSNLTFKQRQRNQVLEQIHSYNEKSRLIKESQKIIPQEQEQHSSEYSIDIDQESLSQSDTQSANSSLKNFVIETQESQEIDINIHRQLHNQQQFQDQTQQNLKNPSESYTQSEDDIFDDLDDESQQTVFQSTIHSKDEDKITNITNNINQTGRIHPQKFYKQFQSIITQDELQVLFRKIQKLLLSKDNKDFAELLDKYNSLTSSAQPVSITSTLMVFCLSSGIDFSDKNFIDQICFNAFTGAISQYQLQLTDIITIQSFEKSIQHYIVSQQDNTSRPYLTYSDYNIQAYRLCSFYQTLQISGLQNIINASQSSFTDPNAKINYLLTKLGLSFQTANQPYLSFDKHQKRLVKKNYYQLSKTYRHSYLFYVPNFIYTNRSYRTIEISSLDVQLLVFYNPQKYMYLDFEDIAFSLQKATLFVDQVQSKSQYFHFLTDVSSIFSYYHFLMNQQQFLRQLPSKRGYIIYNLASEIALTNHQLEQICNNIRQFKISTDYLTLQEKGYNKLQDQLYSQGQISIIQGFSGLKFMKVKFKPLDLLYQDCIVIIYQQTTCYISYNKNGFLGGVISNYLIGENSNSYMKQQFDIRQNNAIQGKISQWMEK